jgi:hypothetical protein
MGPLQNNPQSGALGVVVGESGGKRLSAPHLILSILLGMDYDRTSSDGLVQVIIIDNNFISIFVPDLDTEGIKIVIASPNPEFVIFRIWSLHTIDCASANEGGLIT